MKTYLATWTFQNVEGKEGIHEFVKPKISDLLIDNDAEDVEDFEPFETTLFFTTASSKSAPYYEELIYSMLLNAAKDHDNKSAQNVLFHATIENMNLLVVEINSGNFAANNADELLTWFREGQSQKS
jgi:hypothetical protein